MPAMRAKLRITSVEVGADWEKVNMMPVSGKAPYGASGESEDNTYARYTPSGSVTLQINNPALLGKFKAGQQFYADFTEAAE